MRSTEVAKHGRKYGLMISPWLNARLFTNLNGRPDIDLRDRYANAESMVEGSIAELYDFIPVSLHEVMEGDPQFASVVRIINTNTTFLV